MYPLIFRINAALVCSIFCSSSIFWVDMPFIVNALSFIQVPVPLLKEKIATVTGILSEQQRLICRGRVLKDDELLSAYRILIYFWLVAF
jgi:hypothetical protein